jgi:hypothetical protein
MRSVLRQTVSLIVFSIVLEACGNEKLKTVTTRRSDSYRLVILNTQGSIKQGSGKFYIEFHDVKDDRLIDVGKVEVQANMPMPGMPMVNDAEVKATDVPGRYSVKYDLSMSGSWTLRINFDQNKSATIPIAVN